jgi:glutamate formiminotransferase
MDKIVECVPNFSEGRRANVVDEIVNALRLRGVKILDRELDANHNRSVITLAGNPGAIEEAVFRGIATAARLIDLDAHRGEHPRIGATDVVPFVPIRGVTMDECVAMAQRLGARVARELDIPVYLYERAATRPERRDLAYILRGFYE